MVVDDQADVVWLLSRPETFGQRSAVERVDTHSARVFLCGPRALKLKRAVRYDYLDFSTPERRRVFCAAEVALNRRTAPGLYQRVAVVTREADGRLALDGSGTPVEWLVQMRRFDGAQLLDRLADRGQLSLALAERLGEAVAALHEVAAVRHDQGGADGMRWVVDGNRADIARAGDTVFPAAAREALDRAVLAALGRLGPRLDERRARGFVRQCHGDLHLRNVVVLDGMPTLFDAVEFDDRIACGDVLYDLAFLLMDLWRRGLERHANVVFNTYLRRTGDVDGLGLLPFFLSCRAAVRAKTTATTASLTEDAGAAEAQRATAREYLARAVDLLAPPPPALVVVGGMSGTGKSTAAAALAPRLGAAPGAVHVQSDAVRKQLFGVAAQVTLPAEAYAPMVSARVYAEMRRVAAAALAGGHAVVCDAVFGDADARAAMAAVARDAGEPCVGLWLTAPTSTLVARVHRRHDDVSDATADVVRRQDGQGLAHTPPGWAEVRADGSAAETEGHLAAALVAAGLTLRAVSPG